MIRQDLLELELVMVEVVQMEDEDKVLPERGLVNKLEEEKVTADGIRTNTERKER